MIIVRATGLEVVEEPAPVVFNDGPATASLSWRWLAPWLDLGWDLTDLTSPVLKLRGATGTGQVDPEHRWSEAAQLDGADWEDAHVGIGEVTLPLQVRGHDSADFLVQHDLFARSMDPKREGILQVRRPDGQWRQQLCRYAAGFDAPIVLDPVMQHRARYDITWATADPYWTGEPVITPFEYDDAPPFFPGPPFTLAPSVSLDRAEVVNPGDVPSHAVVRVNGPFSGFSVGVGAARVAVTRTAAAGEWVEVDMRPRRLTVVDQSGVDRWDDVDDFAAPPIPPGTSELTTTVLGSSPGSSVVVSFTPRYWRAW